MPKKILHDTYYKVLKQIKPEKLIHDMLQIDDDILKINDQEYAIPSKITLLGSGKAVIPMSQAILDKYENKISQSVLVGAYSQSAELKAFDNVKYLQSTHPLSSSLSLESAQMLIEALQELNENDFFIYLLSGGNSALVELPHESITLEEYQEATSMMIQGAMPIEAINCVRKHLSLVKGGKLAQYTKARGIVLVLSDVLGDDLEAIGSAPLYCDSSTYEDAIKYLEQYNLWNSMPSSVQNVLKNRLIPCVTKPKDNIEHFILGSNDLVLKKAKHILEKKYGLTVEISPKKIQGDVADVAKELSEFINTYEGEKKCFIFGGEATVKVQGDGKGGRNQHLALLVLDQLDGIHEIAFLSAATDGIDGNSEAAGALIDMHSIVNTKAHHINWKHYLENFDSNGFFTYTDELIKPGPTHNNLLDIVIIMIESTIKKEI